MLLIATDEAGYGPKLGPLVIAATAWDVGDPFSADEMLSIAFESLRKPQRLDKTDVFVDDSKAVYKPGDGLNTLHAVASAAVQWCGHASCDLPEWLKLIACEDLASIEATPWLSNYRDMPFRSDQEIGNLVTNWQSDHLQLRDIQARLITAKKFNESCSSGYNKADLLSESTIKLVRNLVDSADKTEDNIRFFCDRHGGRRFYAGVLQHCFPESVVQVIDESKRCSRYRLSEPNRTIDVSFTVKGDSFTPVALSSMIAKYLRERMMESFNTYFVQRHTARDPLKPTAGYPVDSERFLRDIEPIIRAEKIDSNQLIRSR